MKKDLKEFKTFPSSTIKEIQRAANEGIYQIRGLGAKRKVPDFDDLVFLGASMSRYPLEGYRETCSTSVILGDRFAKKPIKLDIPITIAGMSFGALGANAKEALGRGASAMGTSTTTGDGGMTQEERGSSKYLVYQLLPSRYGMNPDDLEIKIQELREITNWEKPIYIKVGAARPYYDTTLAVKAGADVVVLDGMQGGTAATQDVFIEHVGIPTLGALREAVDALKELNMHRKVQLIVSGGIRSGADVAKAMAMGADAVSIGSAAMMALNCNAELYVEDYKKLGTEPGYCHHCHTGRCPVGVATQDPKLEKRLNPIEAGKRIKNYLTTLTLELQTLARANGKSDVRNLEPEDLAALTVEAAAMARVPLAGTDWIPGKK